MYEYRRSSSGEHTLRWVIHEAGHPYAKVGTAMFKLTARMKARRYARMDRRARTSYKA